MRHTNWGLSLQDVVFSNINLIDSIYRRQMYQIWNGIPIAYKSHTIGCLITVQEGSARALKANAALPLKRHLDCTLSLSRSLSFLFTELIAPLCV